MKTLSELEKQHPEETLAARDEQIKELMASAERTAEHVANVLADADARAERQAARIAELEAQLERLAENYKTCCMVSDNLIHNAEDLKDELKTANERLDTILSKCFIRNGAAIALPCGYGKITDDDKQESLRQLDKAIQSLEGKE